MSFPRISWPVRILLLLSLLTHGLLLLNDGTYWDDWLIKSYLAHGNWGSLHQMTSEMGLPLLGYFFWEVNSIFGLHAYTALAFALVTAISLLIYALLQLDSSITQPESLGIAALTIAFPAYRTTILFCTLQYLFCYALFLGTALLLIESEKWTSGRQILFRPLALLLFFISFNTNSLLVFYFIFIAYYLYQKRQSHIWRSYRELASDIFHNIDYILLPFVYWILKITLTPGHGEYKHYNQFNLTPWSLYSNLRGFLHWGVTAPLTSAADAVIHHPIWWLFILVAAIAILESRPLRHWLRSPPHDSQLNTAPILALSSIAFIFALLPYIVVGLSPSTDPWDSRFNLLITFPLATLIVIGTRGLAKPSKPTARLSTFLSPGRWILIAMLIALSSNQFIVVYTRYQARWVKDRSVILNLRGLPQLSKFSIIHIKDDMEVLHQRKEAYRWYEWTMMFHQAWGGDSRIGYYSDGSMPRVPPIKRYYTTHFQNDGCNASLTILPGPNANTAIIMMFKYFYFKYIDPNKLADFLGPVTSLRYTIKPSAAAACGKHQS